ncbi:MAG: histidine kinase, partial [Mesorhizobium sp.]
MARFIREYPWSESPLGPIETWTLSLRTTVDLMLAAEAQIVLFCGPEFVALYN